MIRSIVRPIAAVTFLTFAACSSGASPGAGDPASSSDGGPPPASSGPPANDGACAVHVMDQLAGDYPCSVKVMPHSGTPVLDQLVIYLVSPGQPVALELTCTAPPPFAPGSYALAPEGSNVGCGGYLSEPLGAGPPARTFTSSKPGETTVDAKVDAVDGDKAHGTMSGTLIEALPGGGKGPTLRFTARF